MTCVGGEDRALPMQRLECPRSSAARLFQNGPFQGACCPALQLNRRQRFFRRMAFPTTTCRLLHPKRPHSDLPVFNLGPNEAQPAAQGSRGRELHDERIRACEAPRATIRRRTGAVCRPPTRRSAGVQALQPRASAAGGQGPPEESPILPRRRSLASLRLCAARQSFFECPPGHAACALPSRRRPRPSLPGLPASPARLPAAGARRQRS